MTPDTQQRDIKRIQDSMATLKSTNFIEINCNGKNEN